VVCLPGTLVTLGMLAFSDLQPEQQAAANADNGSYDDVNPLNEPKLPEICTSSGGDDAKKRKADPNVQSCLARALQQRPRRMR